MKRCPQCEFIYEDDQSLCDMDGVLLVFDSRTLPNTHALATVSGPMPDKVQRRSRVVPAFASLILIMLLASVYYVTAVRTTADNLAPPTYRPHRPKRPQRFLKRPLSRLLLKLLLKLRLLNPPLNGLLTRIKPTLKPRLIQQPLRNPRRLQRKKPQLNQSRFGHRNRRKTNPKSGRYSRRPAKFSKNHSSFKHETLPPMPLHLP